LSDPICVTEKNGLIFRGLQGESDYPLLLTNIRSSRQADHSEESVSLEGIASNYAPSEGFDPTRQVLIAALEGAPAESIGHSRLGWYSSCADDCLYYQISWLRQEFRHSGYWQSMVRENEIRMREIAEEHPPVPRRFFQAWASDNQVDWISTLESTGYRAVRHFNNMLYRLDEVPRHPLPAGVEVRPVKPEHMHDIWKAQRDLNDGLFENVAEDWLEDKYPAWLENPSHTPQLWQVAWDGDRLAGLVLARIDPEENEERKRKRGYTEHIYVRPDWRGRGLARALIARSLQDLKEKGMQDAELGVDAENESGAFELYQRMGYKTYYVDTWFRKAME
jgi:mycothiol synthase